MLSVCASSSSLGQAGAHASATTLHLFGKRAWIHFCLVGHCRRPQRATVGHQRTGMFVGFRARGGSWKWACSIHADVGHALHAGSVGTIGVRHGERQMVN